MMKTTLPLIAALLLASGNGFAALYNFDLARDRGGVVFNASTDDSNLVWNTAAPAGTSSMTWNVVNTGFGNLSGSPVSFTNLASSTGVSSSYALSIGPVNTDGYSDETPRDGVWTSYMTTTVVNGASGGPTITLSGFSPGEFVNLVIYTGQARWSGATTGEFTFGSITRSYLQEGGAFGGGFDSVEGATYVRFNGLVPDGDGNITGTFGALAAEQEGAASLAGLQFEVIPEPTAAFLGALGVFVFLLRRRNG